jgi:hypothetical protein
MASIMECTHRGLNNGDDGDHGGRGPFPSSYFHVARFLVQVFDLNSELSA